MIGSTGRFGFVSAIIPLIAQFFFARKGDHGAEYLDSPSKGTIFAHGNHSHWGSSGMDFHEIMRARRKTRRAKSFKQYRGCMLRGHREKAHC